MSARLLREESGTVLGLAIVLVVLIGVMGAGLLTLVVSDLQTTLEANQGQRAFEMAEAGIEVAKARLAEDPGLSVWSSGELRMERMEGGTAVVTVERGGEAGTRYVATSTGEYAGARRRIEATLSVAGGEPQLLGWRELYE